MIVMSALPDSVCPWQGNLAWVSPSVLNFHNTQFIRCRNSARLACQNSESLHYRPYPITFQQDGKKGSRGIR